MADVPVLRNQKVTVIGLALLSGGDYFVRFWRDVVRAPVRNDEPARTAAATRGQP